MTRDDQRLQDDRKLQEGWKDIAERVTKEQDPLRLTELADELIHALNQQTKLSVPISGLKESSEEEGSGQRKA